MAQLVMRFLLFCLLFDTLSAGGRGPLKLPTNRRSKPPSQYGDISNLQLNLGSSRAGLLAPLRQSGYGDYLLDLGVGTPGSNISLIISTGDDFIWTDCLKSYEEGLASTYYPKNSTTFLNQTCDDNNPRWEVTLHEEYSCEQLPQCRYNCSAGDGVAGVVANDTFRFEGGSTRNVSFACNDVAIYDFPDSSGYAGFGRGPLSLVSQLGVSKFSHCFTDSPNTSSYMLFGSLADADDTAAFNTTSIANDSNYHVLDLQGISVGTKPLTILPETLRYVRNSTGTRIYSSDPLTYFPNEAYSILREEVKSHVGLPVYNQSSLNFGLDLCFNWTSNAPALNSFTITLHFNGADMTLPTQNFLKNYSNENASVVCLMMAEYDDGYSYLGNYQMQNFQFIYDLKNEKLSFRSIRCDQLQPPTNHAIKSELHGTAYFVLLLLYLLLA